MKLNRNFIQHQIKAFIVFWHSPSSIGYSTKNNNYVLVSFRNKLTTRLSNEWKMCSSQGKFASPNFYYYYTRKHIIEGHHKLKASRRLTIPGEHPLTLDMCKDRCTVQNLHSYTRMSRHYGSISDIYESPLLCWPTEMVPPSNATSARRHARRSEDKFPTVH